MIQKVMRTVSVGLEYRKIPNISPTEYKPLSVSPLPNISPPKNKVKGEFQVQLLSF